ncbi:probable disease resistance RPP8-like protein 4 isoform X1 [Triticum dicoccoides]|uniref:probable disease resistance RPP8-like protein 4 isoform X1 n=1 Tax=Triticum dicoccoides TaxID=85692 RepID=UPI001891E6C9|nr:probable disease resistance RPP8-like protein 4 isoform X1 [Triticum dicoccoides]
MADAGVTGVAAKLGELAAAEATALLRVDAEIRSLRRKLAYLQALVRGADRARRGRANELLLLWLRETREVAFEVEDAVDEFHLRVEAFHLSAKGRRGWWHGAAFNLVQGLATQVVVRHGLSNQIVKINERIDELNQNKETYAIESFPSETWNSSSIETDPEWYEDGYVEDSRQSEFTTLKDQIIDKEKIVCHRAVTSILGECGIGKKTLARKLYNDPDIMRNFEVHAWVCLPPHIRFTDYVETMYKQVSSEVPEAPEKVGKASLATGDGETISKERKLRELMQNRRYLVVLDGLVEISDWNSLLDVLPDENNCSRILLTTRLSVKEINHMDPRIAPLELGCLETIHGQQLFCRRVFGAKKPPEIYKCKAYYDKVHNISTGLPLAIIVLAGVLRSKVIPAEWDEVLEQLETNGQPKPLGRIWSLAFDDLPHHLKSCFLYFASMSENIIVYPDRLVRLWIAEGFVVPKKGKTLEEVGFDYLKDLVSRGLVQVMDKDAGGRIKLVAIHNLLHAFLESEARDSGFLEIHHQANVLNPNAVRRLAVHNYVDSFVNIPNEFPKLRSLLCDFAEDQRSSTIYESPQPHTPWGSFAEMCLRACGSSDRAGLKTIHGLHFLQGSRFLRVIDLNGLKIQKLPNEIGSIIHLRYLGIRNSNLEELPSSISKLDNLQTLDVRRTNVRRVVDEFWEIEALRHVLAEKILLPDCRVSLNNLMTLDGAEPSHPWHDQICPLNYMLCLRSLSLSGISETHTKALSAALRKMEFLVNLNLYGEVLPSTMFTDSSMRRLQVLVLHGRLEDLDASQSDRYVMPNLTMLHLHRSELSQPFVDKLAVLPCIAEMELSYCSFSGATLVFSERGFQSLRKLKLINLCALEELVVEPGAVPMLSVLAMHDCSRLKVLTGLNDLEHLQELALYNMDVLVDTLKLADEKLCDQIKCLTTPTKVDRGVLAGSWLRKLGIPAMTSSVGAAPELPCGDLERTGSVGRKATDDIEVHYSSGGAWTRLAQV